ncbi:hypothetical protein AURDEDRAFT_161642 [Auricularia subglabra TFB-10046 SS5]|nr:hypothetical protein AURDEDRAFT_161642 [Auricularia subglabra TFB-10046 SS5]
MSASFGYRVLPDFADFADPPPPTPSPSNDEHKEIKRCGLEALHEAIARDKAAADRAREQENQRVEPLIRAKGEMSRAILANCMARASHDAIERARELLRLAGHYARYSEETRELLHDQAGVHGNRPDYTIPVICPLTGTLW